MNSRSGKRYAQAVFELARERDEFPTWQSDLEKIASLTSDEELMDLLAIPQIPFERKRDLLEEHLKDVHPLALNLALLLVKKGRMKVARNIFQEYLVLLDTHRGVAHAEVATALPLDEDSVQRLSRNLGEIINQEVLVEPHVDPSVIGGFRAKIGDLLIDGSVRHRLESLRKTMSE